MLDENELKDILQMSRENNTRNGLTGILLYHQGNFIQVLEGEEVDIKDTYLRILNDTRYKNVLKMIERETLERNFPDWFNGYMNAREQNPVDILQQDSNIKSSHPILILPKSFVGTNQL